MRSIYQLAITATLLLLYLAPLQAQDCEDLSGLEIIVNGEAISIGETVTVCAGDDVTIVSNVLFTGNGMSNNYTGGINDVITYTWTRNGGSFPNADVGGNIMITDIDEDFAGDYALVFTADCEMGDDPTYMDNFTLQVVDLSTPEIVVDCDGGNIVLSVSNAPTGADFEWEGPGNISSTAEEWTLPNNAGSGDYTVTVSVGDCSEMGTRDIDPENVGGIDEPSFTPGSPNACPGEEVNVTAISPMAVSYLWSTGDMGATASLPPGNHSVTVTNADGCSNSASIMVGTRNRLPRPTASADENSLCPGETTMITASGSGADVTYVWSTGESGNSITVGPGTYSVRATQSGECQSNARSVTINALDGPMIGIAQDPEVFCEGDTVTLTIVGEPGAQSFDWSNGETDRTIEVQTAGTYSVTLMAENGCDGFAETIVDPPIPIPVIPAQTGTTINAGQVANIPVELGNQEYDLLSWNLVSAQFASLTSAPSGSTFLESFPVGGTFDAGQTRSTGAFLFDVSISVEGCESESAELLVRVLPDAEEPFIPQIVSPNGDGSNDEWAVLFPDQNATYDIVVYSRGGGVVFSGTQAQLPWDTGECPNGTYYYQITENNGEGVWQGALSIIGRQ